ncbi:related to DNA repair protein RAD14 [Melanopsichium pennsylvanicum]|uniref:DNA repair protein RAD14 n=2 Tax=Melanopsichium pennsylvanicum TaxID=63383 RepID=A0AAJ5C583_9BASI|nr:related to DNA repair protein RAD14 [Melanopsichium pennsylvanicum 4]SNX84467.1 related to DNA repair protein RAD14 [Melanopsichium pennsylvanicum]
MAALASTSGMTIDDVDAADRAWAIQENRFRAKARLRLQARARKPRTLLNAAVSASASASASASVTSDPSSSQPQVEPGVPSIGPNASLRTVPATSRNAQLDPAQLKVIGSKGNVARTRKQDDGEIPLQRDKSLGDYIEFDLSKLHNSKGGFLIDDEDPAASKKTMDDLRKEKERERQRMRDYAEPGISLDLQTRPTCESCGSPEIIDHPFKRVFGIFVCKKCEKEKPEVYSLLTKTEVKEDYLLTDAELKDEELLPHLLKANPHKATYSNMMLFCRKQVEEFAFGPGKWGSEEGLDQEFERREEEKARKRGKKFAKGLADLRKRTRDNVWQKRRDEEHTHEWEEVEVRGKAMQRCVDCGYSVEVEVF